MPTPEPHPPAPVQPPVPVSEVTGRTLGDVLDRMLNRPQESVTFIALLICLCAIIIGGTIIVTRTLSLQPSEIQIGVNDSRVVLQSTEKNKEESLVIVSPQGWQQAGVTVHQGDHIAFTAGGKISIDVDSIREMVQKRKQYEEDVARENGIRRDDSSETRVPEDYFTEEQRKSLILDRPWVDPEGFDLDTFKPSFRSRRDRYLLPKERAGGLVAAVMTHAGDPQRSDAFFVGSNYPDYPVTRDGFIWFTVNDVQYADPNNRNMFYNDNVGSFWVRVVVTHH